MKRVLIIFCITLFIFTGCEYKNIQSEHKSEEEVNSSSVASESKAIAIAPKPSSSSKTSSVEQRTKAPAVAESSEVENQDAEIQELRAQKELLIQELFSLTETEQAQISGIISKQISLTAEKTQLENQIRSLKNDYANALANTGGRSNSYAETIKRQYEALEKDLVEVKRLLSADYSNEKIAEIQENNKPKKQEIGDQIKSIDNQISELQK
jgi:hypothetical protein